MKHHKTLKDDNKTMRMESVSCRVVGPFMSMIRAVRGQVGWPSGRQASLNTPAWNYQSACRCHKTAK